MQTTVELYNKPAFAGMQHGSNVPYVRSYAAEDAIAFANAVQLGTDTESQCKKATAGANVIGFAVHNYKEPVAGVTQYEIGDTVAVMTEGQMWVNVDDAVVAGATANLVVATGNLTDEAVAAGIEAFTKVKVTFLSTTAGAGLALVEIK